MDQRFHYDVDPARNVIVINDIYVPQYERRCGHGSRLIDTAVMNVYNRTGRLPAGIEIDPSAREDAFAEAMVGVLLAAYNRPHWINVYHRNLVYGGPEEGGWWDNELVPGDHPDVGASIGPVPRKNALPLYRHMRAMADELNARLPPYTDTNSVGDWIVALEPHEAKRTPERRATYE